LSFDTLTARRIADLAADGDPVAREAFELTGARLGRFLADTVAMFDPEAFVLFGGVVNAGELLLKPLRAALASRATSHFAGHVKVIVSHLQMRQAGMLGAAALIFRPEYSLPRHTSLTVN
jgi:glucokinase